MTYAELQGRTAIVTGAAAGIGKALTEAFVEQGIRVAALDIDHAGVMALQESHGKDAVFGLKADVSDPASCQEQVAKAVSHLGGLDILVNNAALDHPLLRHENFLCSPHMAWHSDEAERDLKRSAAEEVLRVLSGEAPKYQVNRF